METILHPLTNLLLGYCGLFLVSLLIAFFVEGSERRRLEREQTPRQVWNKYAVQSDTEAFNQYFWDVYLPSSKWRFALVPLLWFNRLFK